MKWFTHKAVALAAALAAGAPPVGLIGALAGSVLPDMADTALAGGDKKRWRRLHRQSSHWFGWYLMLVALALFLSPHSLPGHEAAAALAAWLRDLAAGSGIKRPLGGHEIAPRLVSDVVLWLGLGGLSHILLDGLTPMGVPLLPQGGKRRAGLKLISTGSMGESLFLVGALGLIALRVDAVRQLFWQALHRL